MAEHSREEMACVTSGSREKYGGLSNRGLAWPKEPEFGREWYKRKLATEGLDYLEPEDHRKGLDFSEVPSKAIWP